MSVDAGAAEAANSATARSKLHPGSICYTSSSGEACELLSFDATTASWRIRMRKSTDEYDHEALLPEESLRFGFCLMPSSFEKLAKHVELRGKEAQGACGRGLIVTEPIEKGTVLFEEAPLIIVASLSGDGASAEAYHAHHMERWRAYNALWERCNSGTDGAWSRALAAFEELGTADAMPEHVTDAAGHIAAVSGASAADVADVLMKFHSNQFGGLNPVSTATGGGTAADALPAAPVVAATALFPFTSRLNHSCDPTVGMCLRKSFERARGTSAYELDEGDMHLGYALRHMLPHEPLTFNYGPEALPTWDLPTRRKYLRERLYFECGCERCVGEDRMASLMKTMETSMDGAMAEMAMER